MQRKSSTIWAKALGLTTSHEAYCREVAPPLHRRAVSHWTDVESDNFRHAIKNSTDYDDAIREKLEIIERSLRAGRPLRDLGEAL
jgi:hypothetical protein